MSNITYRYKILNSLYMIMMVGAHVTYKVHICISPLYILRFTNKNYQKLHSISIITFHNFQTQ